jgi:hypothetical protein
MSYARTVKSAPKSGKDKAATKRKPGVGLVDLVAVSIFVGEASSSDAVVKWVSPTAFVRAWKDASKSVRVIYRARALALLRALQVPR